MTGASPEPPAAQLMTRDTPWGISAHASGTIDPWRATATVEVAREVIGSFLEEAAANGAALVLFGEPGAGKTALLDAARGRRRRSGRGSVRAAGVKIEADLGYAGLSQALMPLLGELEQSNAGHCDVLAVALGFRQGTPPDRLAVSTATLGLLRQAAQKRPLLLIVDDVHWLDRPSTGVLAFVARRLAGSRVGLMAASRPDPESFFRPSTLPTYEVQPLDDAAAARLLDSRFPRLQCRFTSSVIADDPGLGLLTPQEREVAQLAATGLTNRQIGEKLFLSHRTVGGHLHRIFPKLGIATRAALPRRPRRRDGLLMNEAGGNRVGIIRGG